MDEWWIIECESCGGTGTLHTDRYKEALESRRLYASILFVSIFVMIVSGSIAFWTIVHAHELPNGLVFVGGLIGGGLIALLSTAISLSSIVEIIGNNKTLEVIEKNEQKELEKLKNNSLGINEDEINGLQEIEEEVSSYSSEQ